MKKINLRDYYPYYTQDMIVEVPDEVALLLREYMLLEEAYRIRTYRYKAFYSLDRDEGIEREILQKPLNPAEIWEQRQMTELIYKGLSKLPVKQRQRIYAHFFLGMSKADIAKAEGTHKSRITRSIEAGLRILCSERQMGRRGDRRPKEVMNPGCPSDKRNLRNRLWQAGRDNDTDHNGTSSQLPKDLGRVPAAFACSGKAAAYVGL